MLKTTFIKTMLLAAAVAVAAVANAQDTSTGGAAAKPSATQGTSCNDEGTINDLQASAPLICTDGQWKPLVFTQSADGKVAPYFYEGKCSLRFKEDGPTTGRVSVKPGQLADVCLPAGWRMTTVAATDTASWELLVTKGVANVILIKTMKAGLSATMWIYPVTPDGKVPQKRVVELRSVK